MTENLAILPMEKDSVGNQLSIFSKPQKFALQKGTDGQRSQSPTGGAFCLWPRIEGNACSSDQTVGIEQLGRGQFFPVSISHQGFLASSPTEQGNALQTNCNVQFSFSERRQTLEQRLTPDDSDLHRFAFTNPPNANKSSRDRSVREAILTDFPFSSVGSSLQSVKMQGIKAYYLWEYKMGKSSPKLFAKMKINGETVEIVSISSGYAFVRKYGAFPFVTSLEDISEFIVSRSWLKLGHKP
jgi:hypothetical protein